MKKLRSTHARKLSRTSSETARAVSATARRVASAAARIRADARSDAATFPDAALRPGAVVRAAWFRAFIFRVIASDFTAMVFPLLAAAQSSRRGGGTQ